jgi:hypothetical protein
VADVGLQVGMSTKKEAPGSQIIEVIISVEYQVSNIEYRISNTKSQMQFPSLLMVEGTKSNYR